MLTTEQLLQNTHNYAPQIVVRAQHPKSLSVQQDSLFDPMVKGQEGDQRSLYYRVGLISVGKNKKKEKGKKKPPPTVESSGLYHACVIRIAGSVSNPKQFLLRKDSKLWVHCRCPYFTYNAEMALFIQGASNIWDCDGTRGKRIRNPHMVPHLCKHLYAAITTTLQIEEEELVYKKSRKTGYNYDKAKEPTKRG